MGIDRAIEAPVENEEPTTTKVALVYKLIFIAPLASIFFGVAGYFKWTAAGYSPDMSFAWLAVAATGLAWAYTHWFAFLRPKSSQA